MAVLKFYRRVKLPEGAKERLLKTVRVKCPAASDIGFEFCYYVQTDGFTDKQTTAANAGVVEVGPRLNFMSAFSTNAVSICTSCSIPVSRIERYRRYILRNADGTYVCDEDVLDLLASQVHDRMTEWRLRGELTSFETGIVPQAVRSIDLLGSGKQALVDLNSEMGLSMDAWDIDYYYELFAHKLHRNPTDVELFDISQSNSEHSRHWFFRGLIEVDGRTQPHTLMDLVKQTLNSSSRNSLIAFSDNSSAIQGFDVSTLLPMNPGMPSKYHTLPVRRHCLLTAETHNFPTGVAPFPGAETGTGGRIRDTHATGRGSHVVAGTAGYSVGCLRIPGYLLPWEGEGDSYPSTVASPLDILVQASNGASDYGNKFGEPVVAGFARSVGLRLPNGERREYIKPIMFTGGIGLIDDDHLRKGDPEPGMLVVKLGGPAYRIGMGGSAASSMLQGENKSELDFNAVQRGDAEMAQKANRVIRACCELRDQNPIVSIHDQGAGGNCNVLKEIVSPAGGRIEIRSISVGDSTLSVLEIWGAEYQESDALLIHAANRDSFTSICQREKVPVNYVGVVTGDGQLVVHDASDDSTPVRMNLEEILGMIPQKTFRDSHHIQDLHSFVLSDDVAGILDRVLRDVAVGSKRFLTNKVDRSVTGLVRQQQCVGPLHIPISDYATLAHSYFDKCGISSAIGEQPLKGLVNAQAMARMAVAEAVTNLVGAGITKLEDAKCSANWMWPAKLPGEAALIYDACEAMSTFMKCLGIAVDGGKDSLSMAARLPDGKMVKAPGTLVISLYAPTPDFSLSVTPDIKAAGKSSLILLDLSGPTGHTRARIGGSCVAQVYGQVGAADQVPDCEHPELLSRAFCALQTLLRRRQILAMHDRSDGGLIVTLLEMAFAGNCGLDINVTTLHDAVSFLFAEEVGVVLEILPEHVDSVIECLTSQQLEAQPLGRTVTTNHVGVQINGALVLETTMSDLRDTWEATSFSIEPLQCDAACSQQEKAGLRLRKAPPLALSFTPLARPLSSTAQITVAVVREEGSNGDREMAAALFSAGFQVMDFTMADLLAGAVVIDERIQGLIFPGGFSYADVLDSAKGWAGVIHFHAALLGQLTRFYHRPDTFSLGVCNGCQLLALLGWVPFGPKEDGSTQIPFEAQPRFVHNKSGRFESRFSTVRVNASPSIMFRGMHDSILGVWVAHGEGQAHFPDATVLDAVRKSGLVPLSYVDDAGEPTEAYPFNPNGSPQGIAGLVSEDGRHLALMPHPERSFQLWQWPWLPPHWADLPASPWLQMFINAYEWCAAQKRADSQ